MSDGRYRAYPEYKTCDIDWIGELPNHWEVTRIKFYASLNSSKTALNHLPSETEVTFLPMEAIGEQGELDTSRTKMLSEVSSGYTYLAENDVCIAKITPCFENGKGAIVRGLTNGIAFATTEVVPLRCRFGNTPEFLYYLLTSAPFNKQAEGSMFGAGGQKRVADNFVANYHFARPPIPEQAQIAKFLDHETAKIDRLIEKQEELIRLLKEKRQAVISRAVTKGLNPHARLKDSGIEWLGQVPAHWTVKRIGLLFSESIQRATTSAELKYPILSVSIHHGISDGELNEDELDRKVTRSDDRSLYKIVEDNDLAYNMMRAWQGGFGASKTSGLISPAYVVCRPKTNLSSEYFELVLRSPNAVTELKRFSRGITDFRLRLYWDEFKCIEVPVPPKEDVAKILSAITRIGGRYDDLVVVAKEQITLLQERRTALISASVTGKIDVRHWQPSADTKSN